MSQTRDHQNEERMRKQRTKASALANAPPLVEHDTITPTGYANDDNYTEESPDSTVSFQLKNVLDFSTAGKSLEIGMKQPCWWV